MYCLMVQHKAAMTSSRMPMGWRRLAAAVGLHRRILGTLAQAERRSSSQLKACQARDFDPHPYNQHKCSSPTPHPPHQDDAGTGLRHGEAVRTQRCRWHPHHVASARHSVLRLCLAATAPSYNGRPTAACMCTYSPPKAALHAYAHAPRPA